MTTPTKLSTKKRPKKQKPVIKFIRFVMQLADTPFNREVIDRVHHVAKSQCVEGSHAIITVAEMGMLEVNMPKQQPT